MNNNKVFEVFCRKYEARVRQGAVVRRAEPIRYTEFGKTDDFRNLYINTYDVPAVEISMPEDRFRDIADLIYDIESPNSTYSTYERYSQALGQNWIYEFESFKHREAQEERIRRNNPAVQKAWDNYKLMLNLCKGNADV